MSGRMLARGGHGTAAGGGPDGASPDSASPDSGWAGSAPFGRGDESPAEHRLLNRRRRRVRRVLILLSLPFAIAALVVAGKLLGLSPTARAVLDAYTGGDFRTAVSQAEGLTTWNPVEPWIAWFDRGTAIAAAGDYNEAIDDLEKAFEAAPEHKRCDVAVNLSLSWESLGDAYRDQGMYSGAARLYETAQAVIEAAGEGCDEGRAPLNEQEGRDPGGELGDAGERLEAKRGLLEGLEDDSDAGAGLEEQLDRLEERDQDAADEKAEQEGLDRGEENPGRFTDRPW